MCGLPSRNYRTERKILLYSSKYIYLEKIVIVSSYKLNFSFIDRKQKF